MVINPTSAAASGKMLVCSSSVRGFAIASASACIGSGVWRVFAGLSMDAWTVGAIERW